MKTRVCAVACWVVFACAASAQPPSQPPVEAFGSLPVASSPSLSPDGKRLALIQGYQGRPVAAVWTLEPGGSQPVVIPYTEGFIDSVCWANNQRLLITVNVNARVWGDKVNPWYRTVAIDADGNNPAILFSNKSVREINYSASNIIDMAPNDPDHVYMSLYSGEGMMSGMDYELRNTLYQVDVNTGKAEYVEHGDPRTNAWIMDGNGHILARRDRTRDPLTDHILVYTSPRGWREIAKTDATNGKGFGIAGVSIDGKSLVLDVASETSGLGLMSLADGTEKDFYFHPIYDIDGSIDDPWTGRVVGAAYTSHMGKSVYFDPNLQQTQGILESYFPGLSVSMLSWDLAREKIVVSVGGPNSPPTFYLFTQQTKQMVRLGRTYPQLQTSDLGQIRVYDYTARDGLNIPAYLTLPPGKVDKNLPVVILPHGGPMARDDMSFDWESQFLANRGYAVLRPNFRGSSGYGRKFEVAGYGQWGLKMQDDITDGVKKLIADGIADPKRICIVGGSYGGYAALAGAAFTPDLYACAAAWAPVTDLQKFLDTRATDFRSDSWMISTWRLFIGYRMKNADSLKAASPALNAAQVNIPVLLMHGEADATVRIDQSEAMDHALTKAKKKVTFIRIPNETHYMQTADTRIRWLTELEKFLKENIGN